MSAYVLAVVLEPHAPGAARAIVIAFLVIGLLVSGMLTGQWLTGGLQEETFTPAFFLPGIGIGFVGADAAATVGLHSIAQLFFGTSGRRWCVRLDPRRSHHGPRRCDRRAHDRRRRARAIAALPGGRSAGGTQHPVKP